MYRNQHGAMLYFDDGKWKIAMIEGTPEDQPVPLQPVPLQWLYSRDGRALPEQGTDAKMQKRPGWTDSKGHGPKPGETELTMRGAVARILAWCLNQQPDARPCLGPKCMELTDEFIFCARVRSNAPQVLRSVRKHDSGHTIRSNHARGAEEDRGETRAGADHARLRIRRTSLAGNRGLARGASIHYILPAMLGHAPGALPASTSFLSIGLDFQEHGGVHTMSWNPNTMGCWHDCRKRCKTRRRSLTSTTSTGSRF